MAFYKGSDLGDYTDTDGRVVFDLETPATYGVSISYLGYTDLDTLLQLTPSDTLIQLELIESASDLATVTVQAARTTRTISNIPTRVELIGGEELEEKAIMNAANISLVLRESTGIQIQQTSLASGSSTIRIQGLDGRYTQLLRDGFPLYGGFGSELSILQIPPLDLAEFQIIKGSASTLYGGGAIAGLVNMVSKRPDKEHPELRVMLTQTQAGGSTVNTFYSRRNEDWGYTLYGSGHYQRAYDPDDDDFSNIPQTRTVSFNPRVFVYPDERQEVWLAINATYDERKGGDMTILTEGRSGIHQYLEENYTYRINAQSEYTLTMEQGGRLTARSSLGYTDRTLRTSKIDFEGVQWNSFSEASYYRSWSQKQEVIVGINVITDDFEEQSEGVGMARNQSITTLGSFGKYTLDFTSRLATELGMRVDYVDQWGTFGLPRVSLLYKPSRKVVVRMGGGLGYKIPTLFTEEAATINYRNILPIDPTALVAECSYGANLDVNYRTSLWGELSLSVNQLFYYTAIQDALLLQSAPEAQFVFENADGRVSSRGSETNVKLTYGDFRWFLNYAYIQATLDYLPGRPQKPLTPRHNAGSVLMYENETWRIGYETYYIGQQRLSNGNTTPDFVTMGLLVQRHFDWGSPYVNFENFTDQRQSRLVGSVVKPPHENPTFDQLFAPTDGFIFSVGVIFSLGGEHEHDD